MSSKRFGAHIRHYGGFLAGGTLAFATDVLVFQVLHLALAVPVLLARIGSIAVAMVASWLVNRTVTFAMPEPPTLREFLRFAFLGWSVALFNYAVFAAVILARPEIWPPFAIGVAAIAAMLLAYAGMRFGVFRKE
jgi:putative flippase GtrA